jgi:hypothetical protein
MSKSEKRLETLEILIDTNQPDFYVVGTSLSEIREDYLYKIKSGTFENYINVQWDMSRSHAYRMISAAQVIKCLSPFGDKLPINEAQARPLTTMESSEMITVWRLFLQSEQSIVASNIRQFVFNYTNKKDKITSMDKISEAYQKVIEAMLYQIELNQKMHWKETSQETALRWNHVMKRKILAKLD